MTPALLIPSLMMTLAAQSGAAADIPAPELQSRPATTELIPENAAIFILPQWNEAGISVGATLNRGGDATPVVLTSSCADGDARRCMFQGALEGLSEGDDITVTVGADQTFDSDLLYEVGAPDLTAPPAADPIAPELRAFVDPNDGEVDHFEIALELGELDDDVAAVELMGIEDDGELHVADVALNNVYGQPITRYLTAHFAADAARGCVEVKLMDLAGNTTVIKDESYCRDISLEAADEEFLMNEPMPGDVVVYPLGCSHMGSTKSAPLGLAAFLTIAALSRRRRRG